LNISGGNYLRANFVLNQSGFTGLNNMFFYDSQKVTLYSQSEVLTDLRDLGEYVVYMNDPNLSVYNDTTFIHFYEGHLKAGNWSPPDEENRRNLECQSLRTYVDTKPVDGNYVFGGDFNFYTSSEPGYVTLTSGGINKLNDPINRQGNWNNNSSFADIHTQSTRSSQIIECGAPGGLDDRFDFLLVSDSIITGGSRVLYQNGTYKSIGNDGNHFNQAINNLPNNAVPDSIANALYYMSDHLPVIMDLIITYPNSLFLSLSSTNVNCNGACAGTATASVAGGTPPYTYQWNDPGSQTTSVADSLCLGTYTVVITDNLGFLSTDSITITEPDVLSTTAQDSINVSCTGDSTGSLTVTPVGGTTPYTYLWDDPGSQTDSTATGLAAGNYKVIITDNNNCVDSALFTILEPSSLLSVNITSSVNDSCYGIANGSATVSVTGGEPPYTYSWNDPNSQSDSTATGLVAGTYIATVTDSVGCPDSDTITITQPAELVLTIMDTVTATCGTPDTYAAVIVSGGEPPYTYLWDDPSSQTTDTATGLTSGIYMVIVTDSIGCVDSAQANKCLIQRNSYIRFSSFNIGGAVALFRACV